VPAGALAGVESLDMSIQLAGVPATRGSVLATEFKALTCGSAMGSLRSRLQNRAGRAMAGAGVGEPVPFPRAGGETTRESGSREHGASGAWRVGSMARREPRPPGLSPLLGASLLFWALVVGNGMADHTARPPGSNRSRAVVSSGSRPLRGDQRFERPLFERPFARRGGLCQNHLFISHASTADSQGTTSDPRQSGVGLAHFR